MGLAGADGEARGDRWAAGQLADSHEAAQAVPTYYVRVSTVLPPAMRPQGARRVVLVVVVVGQYLCSQSPEGRSLRQRPLPRARAGAELGVQALIRMWRTVAEHDCDPTAGGAPQGPLVEGGVYLVTDLAPCHKVAHAGTFPSAACPRMPELNPSKTTRCAQRPLVTSATGPEHQGRARRARSHGSAASPLRALRWHLLGHAASLCSPEHGYRMCWQGARPTVKTSDLGALARRQEQLHLALHTAECQRAAAGPPEQGPAGHGPSGSPQAAAAAVVPRGAALSLPRDRPNWAPWPLEFDFVGVLVAAGPVTHLPGERLRLVWLSSCRVGGSVVRDLPCTTRSPLLARTAPRRAPGVVQPVGVAAGRRVPRLREPAAARRASGGGGRRRAVAAGGTGQWPPEHRVHRCAGTRHTRRELLLPRPRLCAGAGCPRDGRLCEPSC